MPEIKIFDALPEEEILAQMAEECVEASKAALKLRRVRCGVNPTPVSEKDAFENLPVGNVIGEFTCDKIRFYFGKSWLVKEDIEDVTAGSCLSLEQVKEYAGWRKATSFMDRKDLYAWHISDLKIYDQPKSLSGFSRHDFRGMNGTDVCGNESCEHYQPSGSYMLPPTCAINGCCLSKPPQSWCYVAEAKEDDAL